MAIPIEAITFHKMLEGCVQADQKSWQFFISTYGALTQHLIQKYFGSLADPIDSLLREIFESVPENKNAFLRDFSGASEREFLIYFRDRVFAIARKHLMIEESESVLDADTLNQVFEKVPLAQQEAAWLWMKAYDDDVISKILRVLVSLVRAARSEVLKKLSQQFGKDHSKVLPLTNKLLLQIERTKGENCLEIKTFSDILDGRISWHDKQNAENHLSKCLYCLDRETTLKETIFCLFDLSPLSSEMVDALLKDIAIENQFRPAKLSLLTKVMKVFK